MNSKLDYYINCFISLRRDYKNGGAPHKPILLLSIIKLFEEQYFKNEHIYITPNFVSVFKMIWSKLVVSNHHAVFAMPFYHMKSEPFWNLFANVGCKQLVESKSLMRNLNNLLIAVKFATIDSELVHLLKNHTEREILKSTILEYYFSETKANYELLHKENLPNLSILSHSSKEYRETIKLLKKKLREDEFQEEVFIRCSIFKREIPKLYNNMCAISGMRIITENDNSMIDACHIIPFAEEYNDSLTNGIALCPNLHRAFDRGLISISDNYKILISNHFIESDSPYKLSTFSNKQIVLPVNDKYYPDPENLFHHRKRFGFSHK
ncbi:HNH endonuclease [Chryseobacterium sp. JUb7]|uniref:HNH endonuclease n=1 Tax=Chryseobacterium sp. JUb7 TaxID=2940599 RepID=UPI00216A17B2|nr:HNH endonuclease [Chryseobacterium sp. JUb7]MCS3532857.1 putative restriction endonuclease [Chryseobacterium sp. JUb7]